MFIHLIVFFVSLVSSCSSVLPSVHAAREGVIVKGAPEHKGKLVVFGDSFSDDGTGTWPASNHTWPADPAYYGHRFSNGPVWVEDLAASLGMDLDDYSIAGATSNNSAAQGYMGMELMTPDMFVIMIGVNDAFFNGTVDGVISTISDIVYRLHEKGATTFLLASYPDLGTLPARRFEAQELTEKITRFSNLLQQSLVHLWRKLCAKAIQVGFVNINKLFNDMMWDPLMYGFDPATIHEGCLVGSYSEGPRTLCSEPDRYIFWDAYHATAASHRYVAKLAFDASRKLCDGEY